MENNGIVKTATEFIGRANPHFLLAAFGLVALYLIDKEGKLSIKNGEREFSICA